MGTYHISKGSASHFATNEYGNYSIGEKEITYRAGRSGVAHHSWKGFYARRDSVLDVLVYFRETWDGNVGWRTTNGWQSRISLIVREEADGKQLIRRSPFTMPMSALAAPIKVDPALQREFVAYIQVSDSAKFNPSQPKNYSDCEEKKSKRKVQKREKWGSNQKAEFKVLRLLAKYLNEKLEAISVDVHPGKNTTVTALLKMNQLSTFPLPDVTIISNSTGYPTDQLSTLFNSFLVRRRSAFDNPDLQDYLLVIMTTNEDGVCVLPTPIRPRWISLGS